MIAEMESQVDIPIMEKTTSSLPIETDTAAISTKKARLKNTKDCCIDECECPVCRDDKQLNQLFFRPDEGKYKDTDIPCGHYVCEECIIGIMKTKQTHNCLCPICQKPFTHYGCSDDIKAVNNYKVKYSHKNFINKFPKNSLMSGLKEGGKTRRRRLRRRRTNKRK